MAEEHFTSRRERREAERLAAEQAFEARSTPEQPSDSGGPSRAELLNPAEPPASPSEDAASRDDASAAEGDSSDPSSTTTTPALDPATAPPLDPAPAPRQVHERGALASDHPQETRPPVSAEDRLDPQRAPLPHFETRAERKRYLREHGLSARGDLSTGAIPVIAGPDEHSDEPAEHESYDTAGFGGASDEVAARDFEAPVTPDSAPRPTPVDSPKATGAESAPEAPRVRRAESGDTPSTASSPSAGDNAASGAASAASDAPADEGTSGDGAAAQPRARARRMPIVQPPTTAGVRVVTAASAKVAEPESSESRTAGKKRSGSKAAGSQAPASQPAVSETATAGAGTPGADTAAPGPESARAESAGQESASSDSAGTGATAVSADDAARALAANPETRPMDAVPEAWSLPNSDYEDEETENPPGTRVRAAAVTGNDGRILVGEEPSKLPYIVLGVAALVAIALIVVALVMLL